MKRMTVKLIFIRHCFSGLLLAAIWHCTIFTIVAMPLSFPLLVRYVPVSTPPLHNDFVYCSLLIYCKQRIFCCFSFQVPFPRLPFVSESPGLLLEAFNCSLAGLPPSPASKAVADEKFMTVCLENLHIPFEVLLFLWCCPHWWRLHLPSSFDQSFSSQ